jgi:hypothetical protein
MANFFPLLNKEVSIMVPKVLGIKEEKNESANKKNARGQGLLNAQSKRNHPIKTISPASIK